MEENIEEPVEDLVLSEKDYATLTPNIPLNKPGGNLIPKIIIGVLAASVIGVGAALASRVLDPAWNPFRPSPEKVISQMFSNLKEIKTVHSELNLSVKTDAVKPEQSAVNFVIKYSGDSDNTNSEELKLGGDLDVTTEMGGTQISIGMEFKTIGQTFYFSLNKIPLIPFLSPQITDSLKNQWIKFDQETIEDLIGDLYSPEIEKQLEESKKEQAEITEEFLKIIREKELYIVKKKLSDEKIEEQKTYHYLLALNKEEAKMAVIEIMEIMEEKDYSTASARSRAKEAIIKSDIVHFRSIAEMIYIWDSSYANFSCDNSEVKPICETISELTGSKPIIYASKEDYCAFAQLPIKGYYFCVSSEGATRITTNPEISCFCDGKTFVCPNQVEITQKEREESGKEEFIKALNDFFDEVGEITAEVWIGQKDKLLYRIATEKEIDISKIDKEKQGITKIEFMLNLSKLNQPVKVDPPKEYKDIQDIIGALLMSLMMGS